MQSKLGRTPSQPTGPTGEVTFVLAMSRPRTKAGLPRCSRLGSWASPDETDSIRWRPSTTADGRSPRMPPHEPRPTHDCNRRGWRQRNLQAGVHERPWSQDNPTSQGDEQVVRVRRVGKRTGPLRTEVHRLHSRVLLQGGHAWEPDALGGHELPVPRPACCDLPRGRSRPARIATVWNRTALVSKDPNVTRTVTGDATSDALGTPRVAVHQPATVPSSRSRSRSRRKCFSLERERSRPPIIRRRHDWACRRVVRGVWRVMPEFEHACTARPPRGPSC